MLQTLIQLIASGALAFILGLLVFSYARCQRVFDDFVKKSHGLPMAPNRWLIGNHVISWGFMRNVCTASMVAHEKVGKTIGWIYNYKPCVSSVDLDLIKLIIYDEPEAHLGRMQGDFPMHEHDNSIITAEPDEWRVLRSSFAPAFKPNRFKTPNVIAEIEQSIKKLVSMIDAQLDADIEDAHRFKLDDLAHRYSLNSTFSCFYKQPELVNFDDKPCEWTEVIEKGLAATRDNIWVKVAIVFPVFKHVIDWFALNFHPQGTWRKAVFNLIEAQTKMGIMARKEIARLESRAAAGEKVDRDNFTLPDGRKFSRNMIDYVIDRYLDGKLTKKQYVNSSAFILAAASVTAKDALIHTIYQLGYRHEVQEKLRESIMHEGVDSEYLDWVIKESMRLYPPAPAGCPRTITRDIEIEDGRYVVPSGTFVLTPAFAIHRLKQYWGEDAEEYKPERWADTSNHHPCQYLPFGAGPRGCIGKDLALFEVKMLLSTLISRYRFECDYKSDLYSFDSPFLTYVLPHTPTYATIKRLE